MSLNDCSKDQLLLHICCAPCATHPVDLLRDRYQITGFFFNPNIDPETEYRLREEELKKYSKEIGISMITAEYNHHEWLEKISGFEKLPEGQQRCWKCFEFRLARTAETACQLKIPFFTSTLTIGPNKPAKIIHPIGIKVAAQFGVTYLEHDFKKRDGFKHSCELSRIHGLYRQNYCGCEFSRRTE